MVINYGDKCETPTCTWTMTGLKTARQVKCGPVESFFSMNRDDLRPHPFLHEPLDLVGDNLKRLAQVIDPRRIVMCLREIELSTRLVSRSASSKILSRRAVVMKVRRRPFKWGFGSAGRIYYSDYYSDGKNWLNLKSATSCFYWYARTDSNRRHPGSKPGTLSS